MKFLTSWDNRLDATYHHKSQIQLIAEKFFYPRDDIRWLLQNLLCQFFELFSGFGIDIHLLLLGFGEKLRIFHRLIESAAQQIQSLRRRSGAGKDRPAEGLRREDDLSDAAAAFRHLFFVE